MSTPNNTVLYAVQEKGSKGPFYTVARFSNLEEAAIYASHLDYRKRRILEQRMGKKPRTVRAEFLDAAAALAY
jgi:hypothetical protein